MINKIINFGYFSNINNSPTNYSPNIKTASTLTPLSRDTVSFTGMSLPSQYKSVFDYLAAEIVGKNKKWQVDGSMLSATNIPAAIERLFKLNKVYGPYTESNPNKINWKNYIPEDYAHEVVISELISVIKLWLTKTNPEPPQKISEIIIKTRYLSPHELLGFDNSIPFEDQLASADRENE